MKLTDVFLYSSRDEPPDLPSSKQPLPHLLDILEFFSIQMARHHKSSLYGGGIAGFHEFIQKKNPT